MKLLIEKHRRLVTNLNTKFRRNLLEEIAWNERMLGIKGARGVGKTTLILQYIKERFKISSECLYVSIDDLNFPFDNLIQLADEFSKIGGKFLFIDEIHRQPNWIIQLKNIYDFYPELKIVFTGSSILEIDNSKADLSRRAILYNMQGLSFREFIEIETNQTFPILSIEDILKNHENICYEILQKIKPFKYFEKYLKYGYYPYYFENRETYDIRLTQLINQVLEYDLLYLANIDKEHYFKIKRFLQILSRYIPFKPNISKLAAEMQMSRASVSNYIYYLQKADVIMTLYHDNKKLKSLQKPEKILLHHPNYYFALARGNEEKGSIREVFFVNQLRYKHEIELSKKGDFLIDKKYLFEIGGKNKTFHQIANIENSFIAADDIEIGIGNKIPLWLFGFLY